MSDASTIANRVANRIVKERIVSKVAGRVVTAGEIRFIKDTGPSNREIPNDFRFNTKHLKPLSRVLWSLSCSMGHLVSAHSIFTKIKAVNVSPDGKIGGRGYIQDIREMRKKLSESIETISDCIDSIHDEIKAPHWQEEMILMPNQEKREVEELVQEAEDVMGDPEAYAEQEYSEEIEKKSLPRA
jgi:hypothetical protein